MSSIQYPKNEKVWVTYCSSDHSIAYIITSKSNRDFYFLYEYKDNKFVKLGRAKVPTELEVKYNIINI